MASSAPHTIVREWPSQAGPKYKEGLAGTSVITPGELLRFSSGSILVANVVGGGGSVQAQTMVAVESWWIEPGANGAIDTDYPAGDTIRYIVPVKGAVLYMFLADGDNVAKGAALTGDGNGHLTALTGTNEPAMFYAAEALNNSAGGAPARIHAEAA